MKKALDKKIVLEIAIKTFKGNSNKEWIDVKDVREAIKNILERIGNIKDEYGEESQEDWIKAIEIIKQEVGTLADENHSPQTKEDKSFGKTIKSDLELSQTCEKSSDKLLSKRDKSEDTKIKGEGK